MKKIIYIAIIFITGCNPDGAGCFEPTGSIESITVELEDYSKIVIKGNIEVHLTNGSSKSIKITAGSNLISGIKREVIDGVLYLNNLNNCNWSRKYINPIVEISNSELLEIVQNGSGTIISTETLIYDELKLETSGGAGPFDLDVNINNLSIVSNEVANYYITGHVENLSVGFYYCDGIFYGENLVVQNCAVTHLGSNTIHLNVVNSIDGAINSLGNVVLHTQMPVSIDIEETNSGRLIFEQ